MVRNKLRGDANNTMGNKGKSGWTGNSSFVLKVPLRYLRPSIIYSVPCDWILQRAYLMSLTEPRLRSPDSQPDYWVCQMTIVSLLLVNFARSC